ncbi:MAG: S8 family serine peptidase [Defluviitaleaceae bacterium]|nr:S8 family serine peptidase [Defluviitaleaceae bacterium]
MKKFKKAFRPVLASLLAATLSLSLFSPAIAVAESLDVNVNEAQLSSALSNTQQRPATDAFDNLPTLYSEENLEILTMAWSPTLGAIGFEGHYALTGDPNQILEVAVTFNTPPAVALRLLGEIGHQGGRSFGYVSAALEAHATFQNSLNSMVVPFGANNFMQIDGWHHSLFNGVFMTVSADMIPVLAALEGVHSVAPAPRFSSANTLEAVGMDFVATELGYINPQSNIRPAIDYFMETTLETLEIQEVWNMLAADGNTQPGYGLRIGVLDTGIDYWHPVFENSFCPTLGRQRGTNFIPQFSAIGVQSGPVDPDDIMERRPYQFGFTNAGATSHGTHVAGTVAAIAPYATLYHYRVLSGSTPFTIIIAGMEAAHADGMDVMNLSLGADYPSPFGGGPAALNLASLDGVTVVVAAGNAGAHNYMLVGTPGTASLAITVGSGQRGGLGHLSMGTTEMLVNGDPAWHQLEGIAFGFSDAYLEGFTNYTYLGLRNANVMPGTAAFDAYIAAIEAELGGDLTGQLAVFTRGFDFTAMRAMALALNAAGWAVIDNRAPTADGALCSPTFNMTTAGVGGQNVIPNFIVRQAYAGLFSPRYESGTLTFENIALEYISLPDNISTFSARGPVRYTTHLKPDIVAPGDRIVSAIPSFVVDPSLAPGAGHHDFAFQTMGGTSMASPAVAGIAALMLQNNPSLEPHQVKALMMNNAIPLTGTPSAAVQNTNGGAFYSVYNVGAGFIHPVNAFHAGITYATTEIYSPIGGDNFAGGIFDYATMASLSFGIVPAGQNTSGDLVVTFNNTSDTWTHTHSFNGNHTGVTLNLVESTANSFTFNLAFGTNAAANAYFEGNIIFDNGNGHQITMPFAAFNQDAAAQRFSINPNLSGVRRPIVSNFIRWDDTYPEHRHIGGNPLAVTASNTAASIIHIVDNVAETGTQNFALYARVGNTFARMGSHNAIPVNSTINLTNFININTQSGILPAGVFEVYVRVGSGATEFFGPMGTHNRFVVTPDRPTITFDETTFYFEPGDESIVISGQINSAGHNTAIAQDVRYIASVAGNIFPTDWPFDYFYTLNQITFNGGTTWMNLPEDAIDWDTGEFAVNVTFASGVPAGTFQMRSVEGYGMGNGTIDTFGSNISILTNFTIAQEVTGGRKVTFAAGNNGTMRAYNISGTTPVEIASGARVPVGTDVLFVGVPNAGYQVQDWTLAFGAQPLSGSAYEAAAPFNGAGNGEAGLPTFTLRNIAFDHHVTVTFSPLPAETLRLYLDTIGGGTIYQVVDGDYVSLAGYDYIYVPVDTDLAFAAVADTGYILSGWDFDITLIDPASNAPSPNRFNINLPAFLVGEVEYATLTAIFVTAPTGGGSPPPPPYIAPPDCEPSPGIEAPDYQPAPELPPTPELPVEAPPTTPTPQRPQRPTTPPTIDIPSFGVALPQTINR